MSARAVVASGRGLPDLPAVLPGHRRRRHRRPPRRHRASWPTWRPWAWMRSGCRRSTRRPSATPATTSPTRADVDPMYGTLDDARELIEQAHARGLRVIVDVVPEPHVERPAVVPGGADVGSRKSRRGPGTTSSTVAARAATSRRTTGRAGSAAAPGARVTEADGTPGAVVPAHRSTPRSPTSTGPTPRCVRTAWRRCGSGWTSAPTGSASTSRSA